MVAVDQPVNGLSSTAQINITVLDVNDNNPQFVDLENPQMVPEDHTGELYRIQVSDADIGENGEVTISTYSHPELFGISEVRNLQNLYFSPYQPNFIWFSKKIQIPE